jgi:hypothetical protein
MTKTFYNYISILIMCPCTPSDCEDRVMTRVFGEEAGLVNKSGVG